MRTGRAQPLQLAQVTHLAGVRQGPRPKDLADSTAACMNWALPMEAQRPKVTAKTVRAFPPPLSPTQHGGGPYDYRTRLPDGGELCCPSASSPVSMWQSSAAERVVAFALRVDVDVGVGVGVGVGGRCARGWFPHG